MISRVCGLLRMQPPKVLNRGLLFANGATVPDAADGYQTGCIFQHTSATGTAKVVYINEGTVTSCTFRAVEAADYGEFASLLAGSGIALSSSNASALAVYCDDNGASIATSVYNIRSRLLLTVDQDGGSLRAVMGQLKLCTGVDVSTGIYTAVQGYIELAGTTSVETTATFSCFDASLEIGSGFVLTVDSGGEACGIHVETTGAGTITNNGTCAGILIDKASGAASWPVGISVLNSTTGLTIGTCTTGITVGTCTDAITITGATDGITLTSTTAFAIDIQTTGVFRMGVEGTGIPMSNTYPYGLEIHTKTTTDFAQPATGVSAGIYSRYEHSYDQTTATGHAAVFAKFRVKQDLGDGVHAASYNYVEISGTTIVGGTSTTQTCAGMFAVEAPDTLNLTTGYLCGIVVSSTIGSSATTTGAVLGVQITRSGTSHAWDEGIRIDDSSSVIGISIGTCTTAIAVKDVITISPEAAGPLLDFILETEWVSGTMIRADFASTTVFADTVVGFGLDLGTQITATHEQTVTGMIVTLPASTNDGASPGLKGFVVAVSGAMTAVTSGDPTFVGVQVTTPVILSNTATTVTSVGVSVTTGQITQTAGSATSTAFLATGGTLVTGSAYGLYVTGAFTSGITISGTVTTGVAIAGTVVTGISVSTCTTGMTITGATGRAIDIVTSGVVRMGEQDTGVDLTTTYPYAVEVHCEANADIAAASSSAGIYSRFAIEAAQTTLLNHIAVFGKLRVKANMATGNHCGVYALVESSAGVIAGGQTAAGIFALDFENTNVTSGNLNGIIVDSSIDTGGTMTATMSAIRVKKSGAHLTWTTGIVLEASAITTGIAIGACVTGITLATCSTRAIDITTTTGTTGLADVNLASTYTGTTQWASHLGADFTVTYTPAGGTGSSWVQALGGTVNVNGIINAQTIYKGVGGALNFSASCDLNAGASVVCALSGAITSDSGAVIQAGNICVLHLNNAANDVDLRGTTDICTWIYVDGDSGRPEGNMDSVMCFHTYDTPYLFDFPGVTGYTAGITDVIATAGDQCVGHLKIRLDGSDAYINVFSDNS